MTPRAATILGRFPRHLELEAPGKRAGKVVAALSGDLDVQTGQVGEIRRAHRLADAPTEIDVLRLAGLHGLRDTAFEPVARRTAAITAALPVDGAVDDDVIELLEQLLTVDVESFADPADADESDAWARATSDLAALRTLTGRLDPLRDVVRGVIGVHRTGNGTPRGLLEAAATYLGLGVEDVDHTDDRWWHLANCRDRLAPVGPEPAEQPARDLLALEENPYRPEDVGPTGRRHAERFALVRGGLEAVPVTVVVTGIEDRTVGPMVVNLDTGSGVAFEGVVPDAAELRFTSDGRVQLDGASVSRRAYAFRGSVFADVGAPSANDFVFAADDDTTTMPPLPVEAVLPHHAAHWAVTSPVRDAFVPFGDLPHADGLVNPVWLARGRTRLAVFVGAATYGLRWPNGRIRVSAPRFDAGLFDESVFEPDPAGPPSLSLGFEWQEREAFVVRVWLPQRFSVLDVEGQVPIRDRVRSLLDRHRAAGVHVRVEYADPRWVLGDGVLRELDSTDPRGVVITGTTTWPDDTAQPPT